MDIKNLFQKDKLLTTLAGLFLIIGLGCVLWIVFQNMKRSSIFAEGNFDCVKEKVIVKANDDYMNGVVNKDARAELLSDYYQCNPVKNGDLVYYKFSDQIAPVIRRVHGVPGNRYSLEPITEQKGQWSIQINDEKLVSGGKPYVILSNSVPPLQTYSLSRGGVLKEDEYILLAHVSPAVSDSSNLGLVKKSEIIGKIVVK
jgi:hypothetical protein